MIMANERHYSFIPEILNSMFKLQPKPQAHVERTLEVRKTTSTSSSMDIILDVATVDRELKARLGLQKKLTIHDLGWTREKAARVRAQFAAFAEDWDDPSMDIYDQD